MPKVRAMQGVPAHLEVLKAKGKRRHPDHCRYAEKTGKTRVCRCERCPLFSLACHSAAKCDFYKERNV